MIRLHIYIYTRHISPVTMYFVQKLPYCCSNGNKRKTKKKQKNNKKKRCIQLQFSLYIRCVYDIAFSSIQTNKQTTPPTCRAKHKSSSSSSSNRIEKNRNDHRPLPTSLHVSLSITTPLETLPLLLPSLPTSSLLAPEVEVCFSLWPTWTLPLYHPL